jgi:hypothetical protein
MAAASFMFSGLPSLLSEGGAADPEANGAANAPSRLAGELAGDFADKAREMKASASRLRSASVSEDAGLSLVCAIGSETCFE